jgi:hypothetical protein
MARVLIFSVEGWTITNIPQSSFERRFNVFLTCFFLPRTAKLCPDSWMKIWTFPYAGHFIQSKQVDFVLMGTKALPRSVC